MLKTRFPDMSLQVWFQRADSVLLSLLGEDATSLDFAIFFKWAAEVKITEPDIRMIQRILKISELEATALGTKFLFLFIESFHSTIWAIRCERMVAWETAYNITSKSKKGTLLCINSE